MPSQISYEPVIWGANAQYEDLQCPSGQWCQVRRLTIPDLMTSGLIEQFDMLGPAYQQNVAQPAKGQMKGHQQKQPTKAEIEKQLEENISGDMATMMMQMMDKVASIVVVQPAILSTWREIEGSSKNDVVLYEEIPHADRLPGAIYTDQVSLSDKMFILEWAMAGFDLGELAQFRDEADGSVDAVADEPDVPVSPKRAARPKTGSKSRRVPAR